MTELMTDHCAILAIATTTGTAHDLLNRLVEHDVQSSVVPWTIANKYYTADVKFIVHPFSAWGAVQDVLDAPALLFVWNRGEPYRDQIRTLSQHEFEVALAIRLPSTLPQETEDDQEIDAYLSSNGFEFVDVPDAESPSSDRTGIPGISRVVDALSTVMWPSMVRKSSNRLTATSLISPGVSDDDYHNLVRLVGKKISGDDGDRMQRELQELERWLDQDTDVGPRSLDSDDDAVPWSTAVTPGTLSPSLSGFLQASRSMSPEPGFDDDFTSFVSASSESFIPPLPLDASSSPPTLPPLTSTTFSSTFSFNSPSSDRSTPIFDDPPGFSDAFDTSRLAPGEVYKSLGSVSDLGDSLHVERLSASSDGNDRDLPTRAEIADTSRKIFGSAPLSFSPTSERGNNSPLALGEEARYFGEDVDIEMSDTDLERFDLQSVLAALQGLKEEIAGMPDKERRKAAARVALGLAYGLGGDSLHSEESA